MAFQPVPLLCFNPAAPACNVHAGHRQCGHRWLLLVRHLLGKACMHACSATKHGLSALTGSSGGLQLLVRMLSG